MALRVNFFLKSVFYIKPAGRIQSASRFVFISWMLLSAAAEVHHLKPSLRDQTVFGAQGERRFPKSNASAPVFFILHSTKRLRPRHRSDRHPLFLPYPVLLHLVPGRHTLGKFYISPTVSAFTAAGSFLPPAVEWRHSPAVH